MKLRGGGLTTRVVFHVFAQYRKQERNIKLYVLLISHFPSFLPLLLIFDVIFADFRDFFLYFCGAMCFVMFEHISVLSLIEDIFKTVCEQCGTLWSDLHGSVLALLCRKIAIENPRSAPKFWRKTAYF